MKLDELRALSATATVVRGDAERFALVSTEIARLMLSDQGVELTAKTICCPSGVCGKGDGPYAICQRHTFETTAYAVFAALIEGMG